MGAADPERGGDGARRGARSRCSSPAPTSASRPGVGFLALFGVSVQTGVIMLEYINQLRAQGHPIVEAAIEGAVLRLRPIMMTMLVATFGLIPAALSHAIGSDSQRPFAIVIVGGLIADLLAQRHHPADVLRLDRPRGGPASGSGGRSLKALALALRARSRFPARRPRSRVRRHARRGDPHGAPAQPQPPRQPHQHRAGRGQRDHGEPAPQPQLLRQLSYLPLQKPDPGVGYFDNTELDLGLSYLFERGDKRAPPAPGGEGRHRRRPLAGVGQRARAHLPGGLAVHQRPARRIDARARPGEPQELRAGGGDRRGPATSRAA